MLMLLLADLPQPTKAELRAVWERLAAGEGGVPGVVMLRGPQPGPTVGVSLMTHGNEPAGLAAAWYFLTQVPTERLMMGGKLVFVLNNLEASRRYWAATTEAERRACRLVDVNMNRLPRRDLAGGTYEEQRANALLPVWQTFDYAFDIHSTIQETRPMVLLGRGAGADALARQMGMATILGNMLNVQRGFPAIAFYGHEQTTTLGMEAGGHTQPETLLRAIDATARFLAATGILPVQAPLVAERPWRLDVYGKIILQDPRGELAKVFSDFEPFRRGDLLATEPGKEHRADRDGFALFGPLQRQVMYPGEEILFLLEEVFGEVAG
jgi:predicted deacylase